MNDTSTARPTTTCAGCLGMGQCWVCSGTGEVVTVRGGSSRTCPSCEGRQRCAVCRPGPSATGS